MFILASSSPRRKILLKEIVDEFIIVPPNVDEAILDLEPSRLSYEEARMKAYEVASRYPNDEILSCDTIVILDGVALGKPKDRNDALNMLKRQSGKKQVVISSYTYLGKGKEISRSVKTYVYFKKLSEEQIIEYIDKFNPLDKAGSYGIQDDFPLIEKIEGSLKNVIGLPVEDIKSHIPLGK